MTDLSDDLAPTARAWLETSRSLTALMQALAPPAQLRHSLESLGWVRLSSAEQAVWPGFEPGEQAWQRVISFSVAGMGWLQARVLIPRSTLQMPAGIALQYCGAQSLGTVLFRDPQLSRESLGHSYADDQVLTRHGLYHFYGQPLVVSESFLPALWQQALP